MPDFSMLLVTPAQERAFVGFLHLFAHSPAPDRSHLIHKMREAFGDPFLTDWLRWAVCALDTHPELLR